MNALEEFLGRTEEDPESGRRWSTNYVRQDAVAIAELLAMGVTMGEPDVANEHGCTMCWWHLERNGENLDGSSASTILSNLKDDIGYYGEAKGLVLRPVMPR